MLKKIKVYVIGQLVSTNEVAVASDLISEIKCEFDFDEAWDEFSTISAIFRGCAGSKEVVLVDDSCLVPFELLQDEGTITVNLVAYTVEGDVKTAQMTTYKEDIVKVLQIAPTSGGNTGDATPTVVEQIMSIAGEAKDTAEDALEVANEKLDDSPSDDSLYGRKNGEWEEIDLFDEDYDSLTNKPKVNGVELSGNKTSYDLSIADAEHDHDGRYYTKPDMDALLLLKADKLNSYTRSEINARLADKADLDDVPTKTSELTNDSGFLTEHQSLSAYRKASAQDVIDSKKANIADLAEVATSGQYSDLEGKPTIPIVNNATLTIKQGGVTKGTFTANASISKTIELDGGGGGSVSWDDIEDKPATFPPSAHNHDDRYYTEAEVDSLLSEKANADDIPTNTSDLTNDSGFITDSYHDSTKADAEHTHTVNEITDFPEIPSITFETWTFTLADGTTVTKNVAVQGD